MKPLLTVLFFALIVSAHAAEKRPNILFIYVEDMSYITGAVKVSVPL